MIRAIVKITISQAFLGMFAHVQAVDTRPLSLILHGLGTRLTDNEQE